MKGIGLLQKNCAVVIWGQMGSFAGLIWVETFYQSIAIKQAALSGDFPALSRELDRLQMNIMEMQDIAFLGGQDKVDNKCKELVGTPENPNPRDIISEMLQLLDEGISTAAKGLSKF